VGGKKKEGNSKSGRPPAYECSRSQAHIANDEEAVGGTEEKGENSLISISL
jgi:hypothetical protein